jgi:hypothetical protein
MLAMALADRLQSKPIVRVVDLGCGTGSNIRATYAALGPEQYWTLVDYDARLLGAARSSLSEWADSSAPEGTNGLLLRKSGKTLHVSFRQANLVTDLDAALGPACDLITASALFDLCSPEFITRFSHAVAERKAVFYTVLTYNGVQRWKPPHDLDAAMAEAFQAHQMTDKGFGLSAGPKAPAALVSALRACGYKVREGDSPWLLSRSDQPLIKALIPGFADAVRETGKLPAARIDAWLALPRHGAEVGHTDTLALPPD